MINLDLSTKEKSKLTQDEIELAKARKLELLILPHLRRNIDFFYRAGDIPNKSKAYHKKLNREELERNIESHSNSISTVCKPLCEMVVEILKENGINAETVSCDTDLFRHTDVLITTTSGKKYIINYLEDMENIQTGMKTPEFASRPYYERRYEKFEGGLTTDNKSLEGIAFLPDDRLDVIDENLGYKKYEMYMDDVIAQIKYEFEIFREVMAENEFLTKQKQGESITKEEVLNKWNNMSDEEILEKKIEWVFNYFNSRMDITGHTDFVMYYSRLLLQRVLSKEEYETINRYDCFILKKNLPTEGKILNILDFKNDENEIKYRFCIIKAGHKFYAFSTKPNVFEELTKEEVKELQRYSKINPTQRPSELVLLLCDRGNACPLLFHPLGSKFLNDRASMIDEKLSDEEKRRKTIELANSIKTTDGEVTSITIPYPDGEEKYIYINEKNEFAVKSKREGITTIYHYEEETDRFTEEVTIDEDGR